MVEICECCRVFKSIDVASIPGVPMSIAWCLDCLRFGAVPHWVAEYWIEECEELAEWAQYVTVPVGPKKYGFVCEVYNFKNNLLMEK